MYDEHASVSTGEEGVQWPMASTFNRERTYSRKRFLIQTKLPYLYTFTTAVRPERVPARFASREPTVRSAGVPVGVGLRGKLGNSGRILYEGHPINPCTGTDCKRRPATESVRQAIIDADRDHQY